MKLVGDHGASFDAALLGIKELGEQYAPPKIIDDTSLRYLPAREQRNDPESLPHAAESLWKVLRSRLNMYARRYAGELL